MTTPTSPERVVLLDEEHRACGTALKATVHDADTPLHLAFSCHVRHTDGRLLITRRALSKKTWPGVWTNSFCGHPGPDEPFEDAISRRADQELGLRVREIRVVLPEFRYRAQDASGVVENEFCPVYIAITDDQPQPVASEVAEFAWSAPHDLVTAVDSAPYAFSPWLVSQLAHPELRERLG